MKILALESSTTSAKAMLYDTERKEPRVFTKSYGTMFLNTVVQDMEKVYDGMLRAGRSVLEQEKDIDMISLGGAWHSAGLCGADMSPETPGLPWNYTGAAGLCGRLRGRNGYSENYYHRTGCMVNAIYPFFKLMWLKELGFDLSRYRIAGQGVYNTFRMTGYNVVTECTLSGTGLMNIFTKQYEQDLLDILGVNDGNLPEIVPYNRSYPLQGEAAKALGLKAGIPVIPTNSDGGLNQIGAGALKKGVMTFSVGTSGAIRLTTPEPVLPESPGTWCYLSPKSWMSGAATSGACNCIDWFKAQFAGNMTYNELETDSLTAADGPVFLPFVFGERCPGWNDGRSGGFENLRPAHSVRDMYRAVQEGILFNLYQCYKILSEVNGLPKRIKLSGGILHSKGWTQMCSDLFGREMEVDNQEQSSLIGGAVLALHLMGRIENLEDYDVPPMGIVCPDPVRTDIYRKKFGRYKEYYDGCKAGGNKQ